MRLSTLALCTAIAAAVPLMAQEKAIDTQRNTITIHVGRSYQRPVWLGSIIPNIADDQWKIRLFPEKLNRKRDWIPVAVIPGTTAALIALDSHDARYFRSTSTFAGFNSVFAGNATAIGTAIVPVSVYATGLISNDTQMKGTALLAGEAVAESEILILS